MVILILNPFAGYRVTFSWDQHKRAGLAGGTDYAVPRDTPVIAPADGVVRRLGDGLNSLRLTLADGRSIVIRELKAGTLASGAVRRGEDIAITGRVNGNIRMAPHIEAWVNGIRVPFEPLVNYTPTDPAGGGVTPLPEEGHDDMIDPYIATSEDGSGWAVLDSNYTDGLALTGDPAVAIHMSWLAAGGGNAKILTRKDFNSRCAAAVFLYRNYSPKAVPGAAQDPAVIAQRVVELLSPTLVTDADLDTLKSQIVDQLAGIPAAVIEEQKKAGN